MCHRVAFLYGTFLEDKSARVEFIYEPPQETTDTSFQLLDDPLKVSYNLMERQALSLL
jgi:hypothetical protein